MEHFRSQITLSKHFQTRLIHIETVRALKVQIKLCFKCCRRLAVLKLGVATHLRVVKLQKRVVKKNFLITWSKLKPVYQVLYIKEGRKMSLGSTYFLWQFKGLTSILVCYYEFCFHLFSRCRRGSSDYCIGSTQHSRRPRWEPFAAKEGSPRPRSCRRLLDISWDRHLWWFERESIGVASKLEGNQMKTDCVTDLDWFFNFWSKCHFCS